ncbi:MAG: hypothetical protein H7318_03675 [Oligoflexus sp.]|nr:hypothetical protein [Oligoflexus sp.]
MERHLGGLERQFHQQNLIGSTHMCGTLRFQGIFDEERLRQAVKAISIAYPLLRTSVVADPYLRFSLQDALPEIPVAFIDREDDEHWRRVVEKELIRQFKPGEGLAYFHVLRGKDAFDIIFTVNHCVVDGLTAGLVCRNLLLSYNGEAIKPEALQTSMEARFPRIFRGVIGWLLTLRFIWSLIRLGPSLQVGTADLTYNTLSQGFTFHKPKELNRLARERGSNLFAVISAVILQSVYELYGKSEVEPVSLNTPVSLRPGIGASVDEFGVFLAGHIAVYKVQKNTDTWALAKECYETLNKGLKKGNPFLLAKLASGPRKPRIVEVKPNISDRRPTINISNMGRVEPFPLMGTAAVTEHRAAAAQSVRDPFAFTLVSYQGRMFIDLQSSEEKLGRDQSLTLIRTVEKNLDRLLQP